MDNICNLLQNWNSSSEMGSVDRFRRPPASISPPPAPSVLTADDMAILKKQQVEGKILIHPAAFTTTSHTTTPASTSDTISFTILNQNTSTQHGFVYTTTPPEINN
jgi:hypothetical protein